MPRRKLERLAEITAAAGAWLLLDNTYGAALNCCTSPSNTDSLIASSASSACVVPCKAAAQCHIELVLHWMCYIAVCCLRG